MKKLIVSGLLCVVATLFEVGLVAQESGKLADERAAEFWKAVYHENHVVEIDISLTKEAWESMEPKRQGRGRGSESGFTYAKANLVIDGERFEDAGLRFKGNSSYRFSSGGFKRPLKIDTNRFVKGQKLHGRTKLNLSNAFLDSAFMKEKLAYELYSAAGLATPGVGWASVTLSIEGLREKIGLGVYVLIEQVDSRYLERSFGEATAGSLLMKPETSPNWKYPGEGAAAYEAFEIKEGKENEDQIRRFGELLKLIESGSDHDFAREIANRMDLKQFAGYLAATSILANIDSYIGMPHNYYLLLDKADDKLRLLPWDVNEAFGTFTMGSSPDALVKWDIDQPWVTNIRLIERLFETAQFRAFYRTAMSNLLKDHFTAPKLFSRIAEFERAIAPYLKNDQLGKGIAGLRMGVEGDRSGYNSAVERRVFAIKPFITRRIESIAGQIAGPSQGERLVRRGRSGRGPGGGPPPGRRP